MKKFLINRRMLLKAEWKIKYFFKKTKWERIRPH